MRSKISGTKINNMLIPLLMYFMVLDSECKILRNEKDFFADFNLVDANSRIKSNCIRNISRYTSEKECNVECAKEKRCQSFNRHKKHGFCELLAISKFNESGLLKRDFGWTHFETDDDEQNIGTNCIRLKPCAHFEVCEDTLKNQPAYYACRSRDGFEGKRCQYYKGPGTSKTSPAASCRLLMLKYKSIPDGDYWFKGKEEPKRCERKVDGKYTPWSLFGPCNKPYGGGTKRRNRTCTNPTPKGGGWSCERLGAKEEIRSCFVKMCPECSGKLFPGAPFNVSRGLLFATFDKLLMEYKIEFYFKIDVDKVKAEKRHQNIFVLNYGTDGYEHNKRGPTVSLYPSNADQIKITFVFEDGSKKYMNQNNKLFDDWVHIEISKKKIGSNFFTRVEINDNIVWNSVNGYQGEIVNMKLYLSGPYTPSSEAMIKDFIYEDGSKKYMDKKNKLFHDWIHVEISKKEIGSDYFTRVKINGNIC